MKKILSILLSLVLTATLCYSKSAYFYYETINVPKGMSLFGLSVNPTLNHVTQLFPTNVIPNGFTVYKLPFPNTNGFLNYVGFTYNNGQWNITPNNPLGNIAYGESVWLSTTQAFQFTVIGRVDPIVTNKVKVGTQLLAVQTPKNGLVCSVHNLSANNGDVISTRISNVVVNYTFNDNVCIWDPVEPSLNKFQGFFYTSTQDFDWIQVIDLPNVYNSPRKLTSGLFTFAGFPSTVTRVYVTAEKLRDEVLTFDYSSDLNTNSWYNFATYNVGGNDGDQYRAIWTLQSFSRSGYIRVSTY